MTGKYPRPCLGSRGGCFCFRDHISSPKTWVFFCLFVYFLNCQWSKLVGHEFWLKLLHQNWYFCYLGNFAWNWPENSNVTRRNQYMYTNLENTVSHILLANQTRIKHVKLLPQKPKVCWGLITERRASTQSCSRGPPWNFWCILLKVIWGCHMLSLGYISISNSILKAKNGKLSRN